MHAAELHAWPARGSPSRRSPLAHAAFELSLSPGTYTPPTRSQVRTGCGKSQVSRYVIDELQRRGKKCVLVRHPMVS